MNFFSSSCSMPWLASFGRHTASYLQYINQFTGIPRNPQAPLEFLSNILCLDERIALTFSGVVLIGSCAAASTLLSAYAILNCVRCKPMTACTYMIIAGTGIAIAVPLYVAANVLS